MLILKKIILTAFNIIKYLIAVLVITHSLWIVPLIFIKFTIIHGDYRIFDDFGANAILGYFIGAGVFIIEFIIFICIRDTNVFKKFFQEV